MSVFSTSGLKYLLAAGEYTPAEKKDLFRVLDTALEDITHGHLKEADPAFYLCVGAPGSGNIEYAEHQANDPSNNVVAVSTQRYTKDLLAYRNKYKQSNAEIDDPKLAAGEASKYAENARIWLARSIVNRLHTEDLYAIAYPVNPRSVVRGNLLDEITRHATTHAPRALHVKIFFGTLKALNSDAPSSFEEYTATPRAVETALALAAESVQLYWRGEEGTEPVLAAYTNGKGEIIIEDDDAFEAFIREAQKMGTNTSPVNTAFNLQNLRHIHQQAHTKQRQDAELTP